MKKLMMAVAALLAIVSMASAAKIAWSADNAVLDKDGNTLDGGTAYLVYLGSNGTLDATFNGTTWNLGDDEIVDSTDILGSAAYPSSSTVWGTFAATSPVTTSTDAVYAIIATSNGVAGTDLPTDGYYGVSGTYTQEKDGATDTNEFIYKGVIKADTPVGNIPEPTTYALVGLAAAALALRKRFLKK